MLTFLIHQPMTFFRELEEENERDNSLLIIKLYKVEIKIYDTWCNKCMHVNRCRAFTSHIIQVFFFFFLKGEDEFHS